MPGSDDIQEARFSHALVHAGEEGGDALVGDTLVRLAEQVASAVDCSECCVYEYLPESSTLRAQAL